MCCLAGFSIDLQSVLKKNGNSFLWVLISCDLVGLFCVSAHRGYCITGFYFLLLSIFSMPFCNHCSVPVLFFFPVDDVPPYFKMEPPQTQVHLERNRLVLTCMAEGSWPLEFKWLYNGTELTRFSLEYRWELAPYLEEVILLSFLLIIVFYQLQLAYYQRHFSSI